MQIKENRMGTAPLQDCIGVVKLVINACLNEPLSSVGKVCAELKKKRSYVDMQNHLNGKH